jgi:hypothetical protein
MFGRGTDGSFDAAREAPKPRTCDQRAPARTIAARVDVFACRSRIAASAARRPARCRRCPVQSVLFVFVCHVANRRSINSTNRPPRDLGGLGFKSPSTYHRTPLSYILDMRSVGFLLQSARHQMCTGTRFLSPQTHTVSGLPRFAENCPRTARSDRASQNLRRSSWRVTGGGRSAPSHGLIRGGVGSSSWLQYKWLAVAAALRTLPNQVIPNSHHSPLKMGPRGSRGALTARRR